MYKVNENNIDSLKENKPLISVIVPIYKVENYLNCCVNSIINQTYKNLEIILIDDGSPDKCGKICDDFKKEDTRIKVIHQKNNGVGSARNKGLNVCNGEYISFVDSDDYIMPDLIESLYNEIYDCDYVSCGYTHVDNKSNQENIFSPKEKIILTGKDALYKHYSIDNTIKNINCIYVWGKLFRRKIWDELRFPEGILFEDIYVMPYILLKCNKIKFINNAGYYYRKVEGSITNNQSPEHKKKTFIDSFKIWDTHLSLYKKCSLKELTVAVECLEIDKILTCYTNDSIPTGLNKFSKSRLRKLIPEVLNESLPIKQKIRYLIVLLFGKNGYKFIRQLGKQSR